MIKGLMIQGAKAMGIAMTEAQAEQFAAYHALLIEGNKRMNLTRIPVDDPQETVARNYLDSIAPLVQGDLLTGAKSLIDVGAGAGFPGIPLAILCPHIHVTLLDALKKRVGFLNDVIAQLGLNAIAIHMRAEDAGHDPAHRERYDIATARAVAALPVLSEYCLPMIRIGGTFIAYKGPTLQDELEASSRALRALGGGRTRIFDVVIPDRPDWSHKLLFVDKAARTMNVYPRKPAEIEKRPL